jgi:hypothetical protein
MSEEIETLYEDEIIKLELATAQDMLYVVPQNRQTLSATDIRKAFMSTVAYTREHNITKLLLDFSQVIVEMNEVEYKNVIAQLTVGLMPTHIRKVARITTSDPIREYKVDATYEAIRKAVELPLEFRNFPTRAEALAWIMAPA